MDFQTPVALFITNSFILYIYHMWPNSNNPFGQVRLVTINLTLRVRYRINLVQI